MDSTLTVDDGVMTINSVAENEGVNPCTPLDEARSIVALHDGHRFRAAATLARKDDYNHTQCQGESRRLRG